MPGKDPGYNKVPTQANDDTSVQLSVDESHSESATCLREGKSLRVKAVAHGQAWLHGVREGALLTSVDGKPASELGVQALVQRIDGARWKFVNTDGKRVTFVSNTGCVGISLELTDTATVNAVQQTWVLGAMVFHQPETSIYWKLWEDGDWQMLLEKTPSYRLSSVNLLSPVIRLCGIHVFCRNERWCSLCGSAFIVTAASTAFIFYMMSTPAILSLVLVSTMLIWYFSRPMTPLYLFNAAASYELGHTEAMEAMLSYYFCEVL